MSLFTLGVMFLFVPVSLITSPDPGGQAGAVLSQTSSSTSTSRSTTCIDAQCTTTTTSVKCLDGSCLVKTDGASAPASETVTSDSSVVIDVVELGVPEAADDNT